VRPIPGGLRIETSVDFLTRPLCEALGEIAQTDTASAAAVRAASARARFAVANRTVLA